MPNYRRWHEPDGCYFFTLVTFKRRKWLCEDVSRLVLRESLDSVKAERPFTEDAWVLLPDHYHCIWSLSGDDSDYPTRWKLIKRKVTEDPRMKSYRLPRTERRLLRGATSLWQQRYWEHTIRPCDDYWRHIDYIHYNPVKHGLCKDPADWPYSSYRRYLELGRAQLTGPVEAPRDFGEWD